MEEGTLMNDERNKLDELEFDQPLEEEVNVSSQ